MPRAVPSSVNFFEARLGVEAAANSFDSIPTTSASSSSLLVSTATDRNVKALKRILADYLEINLNEGTLNAQINPIRQLLTSATLLKYFDRSHIQSGRIIFDVNDSPDRVRLEMHLIVRAFMARILTASLLTMCYRYFSSRMVSLKYCLSMGSVKARPFIE
jgi:hypothetical protein